MLVSVVPVVPDVASNCVVQNLICGTETDVPSPLTSVGVVIVGDVSITCDPAPVIGVAMHVERSTGICLLSSLRCLH